MDTDKLVRIALDNTDRMSARNIWLLYNCYLTPEENQLEKKGFGGLCLAECSVEEPLP